MYIHEVLGGCSGGAGSAMFLLCDGECLCITFVTRSEPVLTCVLFQVGKRMVRTDGSIGSVFNAS